MLYDFETEQEIAAAVARKAYSAALQSPAMAYHQTLKKRAVNFLKQLNDKIDTLNNQEIANLLRVLLANGLSIEDEEELQYWINLLETNALLRVANFLNNQNTSPNRQLNPSALEGLSLLTAVLTESHLGKMPDKSDREKFNKWQEIAQNLQKAQKLIDQQKGIAPPTRQQPHQQRNNNQDRLFQELQNKMENAGIEKGSTYWNDVISSFEIDINKEDFVKNWTADQSRIDKDQTPNLRRDEQTKENLKEEAGSHFSNSQNQKQAEKIVENHGKQINPELLKMLVLSDKSK